LIVPFEPEHLDLLDIQDVDPGVGMTPREALRGVQGPAYTMFIGDEIVGCAGIIPIFPKTGEAWALFSDGANRKHGVSATLAMAKCLARLMKKYQRVQATVFADFPVGRRWVEALGFEYEGCLRKYGPMGRDMIMYGRVK
jgi:RimJ/RimL family protein N-acetyltransferase